MTLNEIKEKVEKHFTLDISKETRRREYVYTRSVFYKLAKTHTNQSLSAIGRSIKKDHATVLHGLKIFDAIIKTYEKEMYSKYAKIDNELHFTLRTAGKYASPATYYKEKAVNYALEVRELRKQLQEVKKQVV
jgi:hypothetical protein